MRLPPLLIAFCATTAHDTAVAQTAVQKYISDKATAKYGSGLLAEYDTSGVTSDVLTIDYDKITSVETPLFLNNGHYDINNCASTSDTEQYTVSSQYTVGTQITTSTTITDQASATATISLPTGPDIVSGSASSTYQRTVSINNSKVLSEQTVIPITSPVSKTAGPMKHLTGDFYILVTQLTQQIKLHVRVSGYVIEYHNIKPAHIIPVKHMLSEFMSDHDREFTVDGTVRAAFGSDIRVNNQEKPATCTPPRHLRRNGPSKY